MAQPTRALAPLFTALVFVACQSDSGRVLYPEAQRADVVDDYHGTAVADPYRWLEEGESAETRHWIEAQNRLTEEHLGSIPERSSVRATVEKLWTYERFGLPSREGSFYYFTYSDGHMSQAQLVRAERPDAPIGDCEVVLDPNTWSEDGTISLGGLSFSHDGRYLAYGQSDGGSDWRTWRVRDLKSGEDLQDLIEWSRFSTPAWNHANSGFYYGRYPETEDRLTASAGRQSVWFHSLGTSQAEDTLVYEDPVHPERSFDVRESEDGRFLVLHGREGTARRNRLWFKDLSPSASGEWVATFDAFDAQYIFLGNDGWQMWLRTDKDAPRGRIVEVDCSAPDNPLVDVVPEGEHVLSSASLIGGRLICRYLVHAHSEVFVHELTGTPVESIELDGIGSAYGFDGRQRRAETFYGFNSFTEPGTIFRYDVQSGVRTEVRRPALDFDSAAYETEQVFYESADGTRVPMFLIHHSGIALDGSHPTVLWGYGGFNVSSRPFFSPALASWLELGGVYAVTCLRGGGEYGREWHEAGTLERKQNVFDDFIAAAEWLIEEGYTSREKLAISGGSNGGLLVGACLNQRRDLFAAALPAVGVMDMLRYHLFTIGWAWASDYGRSDDPEMFPHLFAYSPYHNVDSTGPYPAVLVTSADHDDRVVPAHSFKYTAALQHAQVGEAPVLIRIETRAGHGAGRSRDQVIDEVADRWSFLVEHLGLQLPDARN